MSSQVLGAFVILIALAYEATAGPHHQGFLSSVNLGARYSSVLQNRGVVLYDGFQIDPVIGIFFFDDRLEFVGDSIGYRDFIVADRLRLRSRIQSITDKPLYPAEEAIRRRSPQRDESQEWSAEAELFLPGYNSAYKAEMDFIYAKDLRAHQGNYWELKAKIKILDFRFGDWAPVIEPNIFASYGWGDAAHNQYFYGPDANWAGFNNASYGIWFAFPNEADRYYPIVQLKYFEVLNSYREAQFVKNRSERWLLSFIATVGVLE